MKRTIYIILFTLLGFLLQFLAHALLEIFFIGKLTADFQKFSLGRPWAWWYQFHVYATIFLALAGLTFGWWQGKFWWRRIYEKKEPDDDDADFY